METIRLSLVNIVDILRTKLRGQTWVMRIGLFPNTFSLLLSKNALLKRYKFIIVLIRIRRQKRNISYALLVALQERKGISRLTLFRKQLKHGQKMIYIGFVLLG